MTLSPDTSRDRFVADLSGAFPVNRFLAGSLFGAGNPFFAPSPAIGSPVGAEGVKGPKG
jgi:hypothetical protein